MSRNHEAAINTPKSTIKILLIAAVLCFIVGGALVFLLNAQIESLQSTANNKEAEVGSSEQVAKRYEVTLAAYRDTAGKISYLESSVSQAAYVPTLLKQLQTLANTTNLTVTAVRPIPAAPVATTPPATAPAASGSGDAVAATSGPTKKKSLPAYDTMQIAVEVKGTYASTSKFLYSLTHFPKIVEVTGMMVRPGGVDPGSSPTSAPIVATSLRLTAYVFHDDQATPGLAGAPTATSSNAVAVDSTRAGSVTPLAGANSTGVGSFSPPAATADTPAAAAGRASTSALGAVQAAHQRAEAGANVL